MTIKTIYNSFEELAQHVIALAEKFPVTQREYAEGLGNIISLLQQAQEAAFEEAEREEITE